MSQKVYLYVRKGSEEDIREALDDILSSGLVEKITDEAGNPLSLEVVTAGTEPAAPQAKPAAKAPSLGQRITLTDRGGGEAELTAQRLKALWDMNQPRVFLMELPGQAIIEGSACAWYPLDGMGQELST